MARSAVVAWVSYPWYRLEVDGYLLVAGTYVVRTRQLGPGGFGLGQSCF